jgi:hypothetical protein
VDERNLGTTRDPSAIERDIAETRESIDETVEELGQRLAPSQLVDDAKSFMKEKAVRSANTLRTRLSENAVPLGLIGGGLIWMLRSDRSRNGAAPGYYGNGSRRNGSFDDYASAGEGPGREIADHVRERASEMGTQVKEKTTDAVGKAREQLETLRSEQPMLLGIASLALGALVGGLLPTTRREDAWLGETRDQVVEMAAEAGRGKVDEARGAMDSSNTTNSSGFKSQQMNPAAPSGPR